jgi:hypothetical protein
MICMAMAVCSERPLAAGPSKWMRRPERDARTAKRKLLREGGPAVKGAPPIDEPGADERSRTFTPYGAGT